MKAYYQNFCLLYPKIFKKWLLSISFTKRTGFEWDSRLDGVKRGRDDRHKIEYLTLFMPHQNSEGRTLFPIASFCTPLPWRLEVILGRIRQII
jgi:hypothetical protein